MGRRGGLVLAAALLTVTLSGCSNGAERSREEWTTLYQQAITAHGGEMVEYNPVISAFDEETAGAGLALESLGLQEEDVEAFGASVSVMNTQAYAIAAVQPAQDREENVRGGPPGVYRPAAEQLPVLSAGPVPGGPECPAGDLERRHRPAGDVPGCGQRF